MITGHWSGIREAQAAIMALGEPFSTPVLEEALKKAGKPIAEDTARRIHKLSGLTAEDIGVAVSKEGREEGVATVLVGAHGGRGGRAFILRFLEFGTAFMAARPALRPAWDAARGSYPETVLRELRAAYERGIKRFSAKAAA